MASPVHAKCRRNAWCITGAIGTSKRTPNEKWLTDITEFHIPAGKVYLSPMIDCFDGLVIS